MTQPPMKAKTPLSDLCRELHALTGRQPPTNRALWVKIVNAELPAEKVRGRYYVDVQVVAEILGLLPAA